MSVSNTPAPTILDASCRIVGTLTCEEDLEVQGTLEGDVTSAGRVTLRGQLKGDLTCCSLRLEEGVLEGNVQCTESVEISPACRMNGNVTAQDVTLCGTLYGDIKAVRRAMLTAAAVLKGNVEADGLGAEYGASIEGHIHTGSNN